MDLPALEHTLHSPELSQVTLNHLLSVYESLADPDKTPSNLISHLMPTCVKNGHPSCSLNAGLNMTCRNTFCHQMSMKPRLKILLLHLDAQFFHSGSASTHVIAPCSPVYVVISELHVHYMLSSLFKTVNIVYYLIKCGKIQLHNDIPCRFHSIFIYFLHLFLFFQVMKILCNKHLHTLIADLVQFWEEEGGGFRS